MNGPELTRDEALVEATAASDIEVDGVLTASAPTRNELEWHKAETERLRVLIDFLAHPIHAPGGSDPDPDVLTAYNLAVEAALNNVRRAAR
jgi:hypothetical protein